MGFLVLVLGVFAIPGVRAGLGGKILKELTEAGARELTERSARESLEAAAGRSLQGTGRELTEQTGRGLDPTAASLRRTSALNPTGEVPENTVRSMVDNGITGNGRGLTNEGLETVPRSTLDPPDGHPEVLTRAFEEPAPGEFVRVESPLGVADDLTPGSYAQRVASSELPPVKKAVHSNMPHAVERGLERNVFTTEAEARAALDALKKQIKKSGFPEGTLRDTHENSWLVPVGNNGLAVYRLLKNGSAQLRTILIAR